MPKNKLPFPRVIRIEPSSLCNLKCRHCPTGTLKMHGGIMSEKTFDLVVKNIQENIDAVKVVVLYNGGEPFLNKNFLAMLKKIKSLKDDLFVKITSNGMLLNDELMIGLIENKLDNIYFSIDGQNPEENNFIRRNADYNVVVKNIKKLINYKKQYKSTLPKIMISNVQFADEIDKNLRITEDLTIPVPEFLLKEFEKEYSNNDLDFQSLYPYIWPGLDFSEGVFKIQEFSGEYSNYCDQIINTMTVRWNGDVTVCCYDLTNKYVVDNIYNDDLNRIWNNEKYNALRNSIKNNKTLELCNNCISIASTKKVLIKNNEWML